MKKSLALVASSALFFPAVALTSPAEAGTSAVTITNCSKTRHGVTVRIKIRDEGSRGRVRVSHPRGEGNFREPRVRSVNAWVSFAGEAPPPNPDGSQLGGGVSLDRVGDRPSFRIRTPDAGTTTVGATFKLRKGRSIHLSCEVR